MSSLTTFFESDFNTLRDQWEKSLVKELKIDGPGSKTHQKMLGGANWPVLSTESKQEVQLSSDAWKKASITYVQVMDKDLENSLLDDLQSGVRNFFFHEEALTSEKWNLIEKVLKGSSLKNEIEVFLLGKTDYQSSHFKVIKNIITGSFAHDQGGNSVQELGVMAHNLIQGFGQQSELYLGVYVDSLFFHNIAKIRAARLLASKIIQESGESKKLKIIALTSYQGWTLYERYSNMLRNETAVASAYIGGADHIQSSGYNSLLELEAFEVNDEHQERSLRMARNTAHVLSLESMLGVVQDSAYGSYHLENLTQYLCEEAWKIMQRLHKGEQIDSEITKVREERIQMMKTRKTIISGINDFPDVKETLDIKLKDPVVFRRARIFEELRLRMEKVKRPEVYIALFGEYGALNGRLNFVKNYFEMLGLSVHEPGHSQTDPKVFEESLKKRTEEIIVFCALDAHYPEIVKSGDSLKTSHKFIAGKFEASHFQNLFMGQNVYEVLENLVTTFEGRKS